MEFEYQPDRLGSGAKQFPATETFEDAAEELEGGESFGDADGALLRRQLAETTEIVRLALTNEFARALELCTGRTEEIYLSLAHSTLCFLRCALTLEQADLQAALQSIQESFEVSSRKLRKTSTASSMMRLLYRPNYDEYTDEEIHAELINSESLLFLALISFLADQSIICFVKGAFRIRACYARYKECVYIMEHRTNWSSREARDHFESGVRMGSGIFNLFMSYLPRRILRLLEYVGFSGNRQLGVSQLDTSINFNDGMRSVLSNLVILTWHTYVENLFGLGLYDLDRVGELTDQLKRDYPGSAFYYLYLGRYNQMRGDLDESLKSYQLCIEAQDEWRQFHSICHWEMMWCYTFKRDWRMAAHYSDLLRRHSRWSVASYTYQYATFLYTQLIEEQRKGLLSKDCEEFGKRMAEIRELMESVPTLRVRYAGKTIPAEKFAITRAAKFCKQNNKLTLPALEYLYIWNEFVLLKNIPNYTEGLLEVINSEIESAEAEAAGAVDPDATALTLLLKGLCLKYLARDGEAERCFMRVLESEEALGKEEKFLIPHSLLELALLKLNAGQLEQSRSFVKMARDDYTGYLLESIVHFRLHSALRCIKQGLEERDGAGESQKELEDEPKLGEELGSSGRFTDTSSSSK